MGYGGIGMIKEHGTWEAYVPTATPKALEPHGAPPGTMFARDAGTQQDWYDYVASKPFGEHAVVMTVEHTPNGELVQAVTTDPTAIFPAGMKVIELTDYDGDEAFGDLHWRRYNSDARKIGDRFVAMPVPSLHDVMRTLDAIMRRLERLERM